MPDDKKATSGSKAKPGATKKSGAKKPAAKKAKAKPKKAKAKAVGGKKGGAKKAPAKKGGAKKSKASSGGSRSSSGLDRSVAQFRDNLEQTVTLSRERIQEVADDAVERGRITRGDAEKMVRELIKKGRKQTDSLLGELERLARQARKKLP